MTGDDLLLVLALCCVGLIGAFTGRFLNICIERFPKYDLIADQLKSLFMPWRVCVCCSTAPTFQERLPLIRWFTGNHRCHACDRILPHSIPVVEAITALLFVLVYWREIPLGTLLSSDGLTSSEGPEIITSLWAPMVCLHLRYAFHMLMICGLIVATEIDRRFRIIPDGSTVPVMILAVIGSWVFGQLFTVPIWFQDPSTVRTLQPLMPEFVKPLFVPWDPTDFVMSFPRLHGLLVSIAGMIVGAGAVWTVRQVGFVALRQEAMGFGDVVLMAMVGSVIGWQPVLAVFVVGAPVLAVFVALANWILHGDNEIPYGPFLSGATVLLILTWPYSWPFAKRFLDMGPLLVPMGVGAVCSLAAMLYLVRIMKQLLGFPIDAPYDDGGWSSADHLSYYNGERPDEQTGLWPTEQWPGARSGRGLRHDHNWRHGR